MKVLSSIYNASFGGKSDHAPSPMEQLPQDMLVLILQSIDSLRSLRAAVLASSAMYDAFKAAKIETLACVVSHSIPEEVHADAVALSVVVHMHDQEHKMIARGLLARNLWEHQPAWAYLPRNLSSPQLLHFHWFVE